ncbi:MAG: Methionyl-tRNA formyltransferase [Dehalococcoidia bacterium]|nr:Methionyl-tRNA formyltransferase [Chloroflexota bacterium]MBT9166266.1 Methionyl-tRNA formyltransferase [Chloroflexota bacterium]
MRIVFMGTPEFSVIILRRLISSEHEVIAVYSQVDKLAGRGRISTAPPVKRVAQEHGLAVFQPKRLRDKAEVGRLADLKPDVVVVAAFGQILPQEVLDIPEFGCLNVHPSLLPRHRGASPIVSAILAGDAETGITIMLMDAGMDTGPVLSQERVSIYGKDTAVSLGSRLAQVGADLLIETLPQWFEHRLQPQPQKEEDATYTRPILKSDGEIDWNLPATELWRRVRAFYPWPGCFTLWQGKVLKILEAVALPPGGEVEPGMVVSLSSEVPVGVGTGEGILGLHRVQIEGKRPMPAAEFLHGQRTFIGQRLPHFIGELPAAQ